MKFQFLRLTRFRNYESVELTFENQLVTISGPNGIGKTNLLEAIHYLCTARGFAPDRESIQHDAPYFMIESRLNDCPNFRDMACGYWPGRGKKLIADQKPLSRISDHLGKLPVVCVLPDDNAVVRNAAQARRTWLDSLMTQFDRQYLESYLGYERALKQRNALLLGFSQGQFFDPHLLEPWNEQLVQHGWQLTLQRCDFIEAFQPVFQERHKAIVGDRETPTLSYEPNIEACSPTDFMHMLEKNVRSDSKAGRTLKGPHRDELIFNLNNKPVRKFGSQGQVKSWVVALRFAQYAWLMQQTDRPPFLLLDDIFDKLDEERVTRIADVLHHEVPGQVFVTDTSEKRLAEVWKKAGLTDVQNIFPQFLRSK